MNVGDIELDGATSMRLEDVVVRPARIEDAESLVAHAGALALEPDNQTGGAPDEVCDVDAQRRFVQGVIDDPRTLFLVAETAGELVGETSLRMCSRLRGFAHARIFGISLAARARRIGLGTAMMTRVIAWAGANAVTRIELGVSSQNAAAIALYKKMGFELEGRQRDAFQRNGVFIDELSMALLLKGR